MHIHTILHGIVHYGLEETSSWEFILGATTMVQGSGNKDTVRSSDNSENKDIQKIEKKNEIVV